MDLTFSASTLLTTLFLNIFGGKVAEKGAAYLEQKKEELKSFIDPLSTSAKTSDSLPVSLVLQGGANFTGTMKDDKTWKGVVRTPDTAYTIEEGKTIFEKKHLSFGKFQTFNHKDQTSFHGTLDSSNNPIDGMKFSNNANGELQFKRFIDGKENHSGTLFPTQTPGVYLMNIKEDGSQYIGTFDTNFDMLEGDKNFYDEKNELVRSVSIHSGAVTSDKLIVGGVIVSDVVVTLLNDGKTAVRNNLNNSIFVGSLSEDGTPKNGQITFYGADLRGQTFMIQEGAVTR